MYRTLTQKEKEMQSAAVDFIKKNKTLLINTFADPHVYTSRNEPISIFMAGVPGAGKTEVSRRLIEEMKTIPVRIDADDIRTLFCDIGYNGKNSYVFQKAASHGVDKLFDYVQKKKLHAIIDGTFASNNSIHNIDRALRRNRKVLIYYIYQDPKIAWKIAKGRELREGRHVPKQAFIHAYKKSMENVNYVKKCYPEVKLNVVIKNTQDNLEKQYLNVQAVDPYIKKVYNNHTLGEKLI